MKLFDLPKELRDLAIKRMFQRAAYHVDSEEGFEEWVKKIAERDFNLLAAFLWRKTPEGYDFWAYVNGTGKPPPKEDTTIAGFISASEYSHWDVKYRRENLIVMIKNTP